MFYLSSLKMYIITFLAFSAIHFSQKQIMAIKFRHIFNTKKPVIKVNLLISRRN